MRGEYDGKYIIFYPLDDKVRAARVRKPVENGKRYRKLESEYARLVTEASLGGLKLLFHRWRLFYKTIVRTRFTNC